MNVIKLRNTLLKWLKRADRVTIKNSHYFSVSASTLSHTACDNYNTSFCANTAQDLVAGQRSVNNVTKQYNSRVRNNFLGVFHPRTVSCMSFACNGEKHIGYKTYYGSYNRVRHFSSANIDSVAEAKVPMQFSGIFKTISDSTPVKIAQDNLLWIHDYTGLPWWLVIVLTTVMMRATVTLPLSLYQHYIIAKLENLKFEMDEIIKELKKETSYGILKYDWPKEHAKRLYNHSVKKQWNKLIVRENCHPAKASILVLVQIPLWVSLSVSIRNLCYMLPKQDISAYTTYQEFTTGGFLWITDLTVADPFVLPIAMALFNLAIIEINHMSRIQELTKLKRYMIYFFRIVVIGMIPITMYVPSCVSLYWATSSAFGLLQNLILLSPKLRRFAKVPITASELPHPYALLRERTIARCRWIRKVEIPPKI